MLNKIEGTPWLWLLGILGAIFLVVVLYLYSQQVEACDKKGGVLVKSGINNVCVQEK